MSWLECTVAHARQHGLSHLEDRLLAFAAPWPRGGPPAPPETPWMGDFHGLHAEVVADPLEPRMLAALSGEVDEAQVALFVRRAAGADALLASSPRESHRVLRVGFRVRLASILSGPRPRALRVRALADFYVSLAARESWERSQAPSVFDVLQRTGWERRHPGVEHLHVGGDMMEGPVFLHALRLDPSRVRLEVADRREARATLAESAQARGALGAFSGGFFLYSEPDIEPPDHRYDPVGLMVVDGQVLQSAHLSRPALCIGDEVAIRTPGLGRMWIGGEPLTPTRWVTRASALVGPDEPSLAITSGQVVAVGRSLLVPLNGFVVPAEPAPVGTPVRHEPPAGCRHAVAGGPTLSGPLDMAAEDFWATAPPRTFSQDETGDANLLPRLGVGLDAQGRVLVLAADGRNLDRAFGLTLGGLGRALHALGAVRSMNLDGGSSKRLVLDGRTLDLSTTELVTSGAPGARRPVHSAVFIHRR